MKHVVNQCIAAGLVQSDVHASVDGTQVRANASIHSLKEITLAPVESIENYLARTARQDEQTDGVTRDSDDDSQPPAPPARKEQRLEDEATHEDFHGKTFSNKTHRSVTDPDARLYKKSGGQKAHLRYLVHHVTDVKSGVIIKGLYHIQNVNGLHSRLKQWIDRFKGVATKYLDNYLAWFLFVDSRSNESTKQHIKEFLLNSFVFEMTDTYDSL